jgi:basic membrane protein A and related proteins
MRKHQRLLTAVSLVAVLGLVAAACGDDDGDSSDTTAAEGTAVETTIPEIPCPVREGEDPVKVGLLFDITGRGDKSFNDAAAAGLDQAVTDLGVEASESTPTGDADRAERLKGLVDAGNQVIIGVGFLWTDAITAGAVENPGVAFGIIDGFVPVGNVASLGFAEQEGSYLVGVAAALKTQTDKVGFIGGVENDLIKRFEIGFTEGVKAVNPDIEVLAQYISQPPDFSGFADSAKGKEIAAAQYEAGADIIYSAAGQSGLGAFEAAKEAGDAGDVWAIGVDSDQYNLVGPDLQPYILTSMLKRVDVAVFEFITSFVEGQEACGAKTFDLTVDGVGYSTSGGFVDDIADQIDEYATKIKSGEIVVPSS